MIRVEYDFLLMHTLTSNSFLFFLLAPAPAVSTVAPSPVAPGATYVDIPLSNVRKVRINFRFFSFFFAKTNKMKVFS